eukprot:8446350-Heterocapsa_arctica.AAC.1
MEVAEGEEEGDAQTLQSILPGEVVLVEKAISVPSVVGDEEAIRRAATRGCAVPSPAGNRQRMVRGAPAVLQQEAGAFPGRVGSDGRRRGGGPEGGEVMEESA